MKHKISQKGEALITIIIFVIIAITVISAGISIMIINVRSATDFQEGLQAYTVAESGMENALMELLRNPTYAGETLVVGGGSAVITISGTTQKTLVSQGIVGNYRRKIQVVADDSSGVLTISSWKEIYN